MDGAPGGSVGVIYEYVTVDGATANDWHCVTPAGDHVSMNLDDACTQTYPYAPSVFSRAADTANPNSWGCWSS